MKGIFRELAEVDILDWVDWVKQAWCPRCGEPVTDPPDHILGSAWGCGIEEACWSCKSRPIWVATTSHMCGPCWVRWASEPTIPF